MMAFCSAATRQLGPIAGMDLSRLIQILMTFKQIPFLDRVILMPGLSTCYVDLPSQISAMNPVAPFNEILLIMQAMNINTPVTTFLKTHQT